MATIKIPYTYKKYENSRLATWADKTVQKGSGLMLFMWGFVFLPLATLILIFTPSYDENPALFALMGIPGMLLGFVCPILFPMIFKKIWDKRNWSDKIALLLLPLVLLTAALLIRNQVSANAPDKYHKKMSAAFAGEDYTAAQGDRCTLYFTAEDRYTSDGIPKELLAKKPGEVGYILRATEGTECYGFTSEPKNWGDLDGEWVEVPLYYRTYTIEWIDCQLGSVVYTQTIHGIRPTTETPKEGDGYYGELPSGFEMEWEIEKGYDEVSQQTTQKPPPFREAVLLYPLILKSRLILFMAFISLCTNTKGPTIIKLPSTFHSQKVLAPNS